MSSNAQQSRTLTGKVTVNKEEEMTADAVQKMYEVEGSGVGAVLQVLLVKPLGVPRPDGFQQYRLLIYTPFRVAMFLTDATAAGCTFPMEIIM